MGPGALTTKHTTCSTCPVFSRQMAIGHGASALTLASDFMQAGALGDQLVLGLIPDSEILRCKGPPVMNEAERKTMVESVKWVGEVITGADFCHTIPLKLHTHDLHTRYNCFADWLESEWAREVGGG
jgi:hypothetical protein